MKTIALKKKAAALVSVGIAGACVAAAALGQPAANATEEDTGSTGVGVTASAMDQYATVYPLQYWSFVMGGDLTDDIDDGFTARESFSHATMGKYMTQRAGNNDGALRAVCMSCKSSAVNELYEREGDAIFGEATTETTEVTSEIGYWDCGTCHADMTDPAGSLGSQLVVFNTVGSTLVADISAEEAACGQCHNNTTRWVTGVVTSMDDCETADPYRYGYGPEGMMRAYVEDKGEAAKTVIDESTGVYIYAGGSNANVESFQGSVHEEAGLTCVDCHMPASTAADGTEYTSHNASGSVLESSAALTKCLECHAAQGVETVGEMYAFVREAQADLAALDASTLEALASLNDAIADKIESGVDFDDASLEQAREAYAKAAYYRIYVYGNNGSSPVSRGGRGEGSGELVAHNPEMFEQYLQRAIAICEDAETELA